MKKAMAKGDAELSKLGHRCEASGSLRYRRSSVGVPMAEHFLVDDEERAAKHQETTLQAVQKVQARLVRYFLLLWTLSVFPISCVPLSPYSTRTCTKKNHIFTLT